VDTVILVWKAYFNRQTDDFRGSRIKNDCLSAEWHEHRFTTRYST
jgi:hypothetical protein